MDPIPVLIFDEIDAQIGGRLGTITGKKLREISRKRQVLLITHLPQIASFADAHLKAAVENTLRITDPTPTDMLSLTSFYVGYDEIMDLTGIQYATNLMNLLLPFNQISDISALSSLTNLMVINLNYFLSLRKFRLHPVIHTLLEFNLAQNIEG